MSADVDHKALAVREHEGDWRLVDALWGGTRAMREARETYLPRFDRERPDVYDARLHSSFLLPVFRDAVDDLASKPFSQEITLRGESLPDLIDEVEEDADGDGCTLSELGLQLFREGLRYGAWHLLVDYTGDGTQSTRDEVDARARPVLIPIPAKCLLGWRSEDGALQQLRYRVETSEPDGDYGEQRVERVVIWTRDGAGAIVETWRRGIERVGTRE